MRPKCAWVDYCGGLNVLFALELRQRGIQLDSRETIEEFLEDFDLSDYPVLLYHPGIKEQHRLKEIREKFPNTRVALITAPCSGTDYMSFKPICCVLLMTLNLLKNLLEKIKNKITYQPIVFGSLFTY